MLAAFVVGLVFWESDVVEVSERPLEDEFAQKVPVHDDIEDVAGVLEGAALDVEDDVLMIEFVVIAVSELGLPLPDNVRHGTSEQEVVCAFVEDSAAVLKVLALPPCTDDSPSLAVNTAVLGGTEASYNNNRRGAPHACEGLFSHEIVLHSSSETFVAPTSTFPHSPKNLLRRACEAQGFDLSLTSCRIDDRQIGI